MAAQVRRRPDRKKGATPEAPAAEAAPKGKRAPTGRKAKNLRKYELALKRGAGLAAADPSTAFADLVGREPDPGVAADVADRCRDLLDRLGDAELRAVAVWKMEGHTNEEIAAKLGRAVGSVERKLRTIRAVWAQDPPP